MRLKRRLLCLVWLVSLSAVLLVTVCNCCRAEGSYPIYESELNRLLKIIDSLENNYDQAKSNLQTSKQQLKQQETQLQMLQNQLMTLKSQIEKSESLSTQLSEKLRQAETNLRMLEESFLKYKNEVNARIRRLTIQRNVLAGVVVVLGILVL